MISTKLITPPAWTANAVCATVDPDIFYPRKGGATTAAKRICAMCPVIEECLGWALEYEAGSVDGADSQESHGVFGGLSANERRAVLNEQAAALREAS